MNSNIHILAVSSFYILSSFILSKIMVKQKPIQDKKQKNNSETIDYIGKITKHNLQIVHWSK